MAETETKTPFTEAGECLDEITFVFDDEQKLFVSQNFLHYVSPVFKAMFANDFKEKETRVVKLKGKRYDDFLEFLLRLHPDEQKSVDDKNALQIINIADEYQATSIVKKCKKAMSEMIESEVESAKREHTTVLERLRRARTCLRIFTAAEYLKYDETVTRACKSLVQFGHAIFTGTVSEETAYPRRYYRGKFGSSKEENDDPLADCKRLFNDLSKDVQHKLLLERLRLRDDLEMYKQ